MLGFYSTFQKRLSKAFIQPSLMPHQRLSKQHLLFEFPEKTNKHLYSFSTHAYWTERPGPKRFSTNVCTVTPLIHTHTHTHTHTHIDNNASSSHELIHIKYLFYYFNILKYFCINVSDYSAFLRCLL